MTDDPRRQQGDEPVEAYVYRSPYGRSGPEEIEEISLLELVNVLLRHRWKVLGLSVVAAVAIAGFTLSDAPTYTSQASFMPQAAGSGGQLSRLSGVASQFGIDVPSGGSGQSPQFYARLLISPRILQSTVQSEYSVVVDGDTVSGSLAEVFEIKAESPARALEQATGALEGRISVDTNPETGIVELSVTTSSAALSKQIGDRLLELVNRFNLEVRQSQAAAQAKFVQERLERARRELRAAEDSLERFLERNRSFQNSPALQFEHQRLQRQVDLKQQVYSSLATRYEETEIARVRDTPVITVVTPPELPASPDPKRLRLRALLGLLLGGGMGIFWAFGAEFNRSVREEEREDYREFRSLRKETVGDLRRAGRRLLGGFGENEES